MDHMTERFGLRAVRMIGVAAVSLLLIVGGAYAADQLASSGARDELAAPTATVEPAHVQGAETTGPSASPEASDDNGDDASESPDASDDNGDDASESPDASDDNDDDADDDSSASPGATFDDDGDDTDDDSSASPGATFDDHGGDDSSPEPSDDHGGQG
jgi:hypothetical protein